ncbi:MAG: hypothetical protein AAF617_09485, partial [Bacteroidota bacterium]
FDIIYPEKMAIGDSLLLNKETLRTYGSIQDVQLSESSLVLKKVFEKDDERTAIFSVKLNFQSIIDKKDNLKMGLKMEGVLERSLEKFYDKRMNLSGTFTAEGDFSENIFTTITAPANLTVIVKLK